MYELQDVYDIRTAHISFDEKITLVTFNDGKQYCSHCGTQPVDYFSAADESARWDSEGGR